MDTSVDSELNLDKENMDPNLNSQGSQLLLENVGNINIVTEKGVIPEKDCPKLVDLVVVSNQNPMKKEETEINYQVQQDTSNNDPITISDDSDDESSPTVHQGRKMKVSEKRKLSPLMTVLISVMTTAKKITLG